MRYCGCSPGKIEPINPWPPAHPDGCLARLSPWDSGRVASPRWVLCWLSPNGSATRGPRPTCCPSGRPLAYPHIAANSTGRCTMQLNQFHPQIGTWKVPKTWIMPILEGAPYCWGHPASPGHKAMSVSSPVLPRLSKPPTLVNIILVVGFTCPAGCIQLQQHGICLLTLYLHGGGREGSFIPKSQICWHVTSRDFFWPTTKIFTKWVLDRTGA